MAITADQAKDVDLSPGKAVTVEIKTGHRRLLEYFLSPVMRPADLRVRERWPSAACILTPEEAPSPGPRCDRSFKTSRRTLPHYR